jgi:hypothetical protein
MRPGATSSWVALVAATTLGDASAATLQAEVRAYGLPYGAYRLVVQSYDRDGSRTDDPMPSRRERPVGSVQREVTADELRTGVRVSVLEFRDAQPSRKNTSMRDGMLVVAWVEASGADLEFDGRTARPRPGNVYGLARRAREQGAVLIRLDRKFERLG